MILLIHRNSEHDLQIDIENWKRDKISSIRIKTNLVQFGRDNQIFVVLYQNTANT